MLTLNQINEITKKNAETIKAIREELTATALKKKTPEENEREKDRAQYAVLLQIENAIWSDNRRQVVFMEAMKAIKAVLTKYNGKPYGEKTRQKISDEIKTACGCRFWISTESYTRGGSCSICPAAPDGYSDNSFRYDDFEIFTRYNAESKTRARILTEDNKINAAAVDDLYLSNCKEYNEKPAAAALELFKAAEEVEKARKACSAAESNYNSLAPSGYDHIYTSFKSLAFRA